MFFFNLKRSASMSTVLFFLVILLVAACFYWMDLFAAASAPLYKTILDRVSAFDKGQFENPRDICNGEYLERTCPNSNYGVETGNLMTTSCPEYFRWIHEDLRPWKSTWISRDMMERAKEFATFRLVIVNGKIYVEKFRDAFQTRDVFTEWGILQLLRLYPGEVPDLELMFSCRDRPQFQKHDHQGQNTTSPPAMFHYCGREEAVGLVFPDWSFWGWPEINVKPWENLLENILEGNRRTKWNDRLPYAYWKGNPTVASTRQDLMLCNVSDKYDWNARLYTQEWGHEAKQGFKNSRLEDQCTHRFKIYIEGRGWSVSEKYIMACDSMSLLVKSKYFDFFSRSMVPMQHYWPIRSSNKCRDLKFAVEWGNNHTDQAKAIGTAGSKYMQDELKMKNVYDYMLHLLIEYSKLLKFQPSVPPGATEICSETMACSRDGLEKDFMLQSMVKSASGTVPCSMPPDDPALLQAFIERKDDITRQVETWGSKYWKT